MRNTSNSLYVGPTSTLKTDEALVQNVWSWLSVPVSHRRWRVGAPPTPIQLRGPALMKIFIHQRKLVAEKL